MVLVLLLRVGVVPPPIRLLWLLLLEAPAAVAGWKLLLLLLLLRWGCSWLLLQFVSSPRSVAIHQRCI